MKRIASKQFMRLTDLAGQDANYRTAESLAAFESYASKINWPQRSTPEQRAEWSMLAENWNA